MYEKIFSQRWKIGGILIFICTILEIHGSSISLYSNILSHPEISDIIWGHGRPIRSDEWIVLTPFALSQYFNNFEMISEIVRGTETNMFMTYGQAVWHPAVIFRPAYLGFLFLDQGSGLAFFWMSRLIILFLVSFEFARIIIQTDNKFSVLYALMMAFSPLAQWWWAVNSVVEIFAAGQGMVVFWKLYLENEENRKRFIYLSGFLYCIGVFVFVIYPVFQVPFGYIFLFCLLVISYQKNNTLKIILKDKLFLFLGLLLVALPIAHAFYLAKEMIALQLGTEYPGQRFTLGGGITLPTLLTWIFSYSINIILPFKDITEGISNNCEAASFFTLSPLGILLFLYLRFKLKIKDQLLTAFFMLIILFGIWELVQLPELLAKITCMSRTTANRVRSAIDFLQLLMLFRGLSLVKNFLTPFFRILIAEFIAALTIIACYYLSVDWHNIGTSFVIFFITSLIIFFFLTPMNKKFFFTLVILILGMGATVNPINKGVDAIYKIPVGEKISEIVAQNKDSLWIVIDDGTSLNDIPIMYGAKTINSVNVYPVLERWGMFDPEGKNLKIYNRFAHIIITLTNDLTNFPPDRSGMDYFKINLNVNDLKKLNARYIFSKYGDLENFSNDQIKIIKIYVDVDNFIYEIKM